MNLQAELHKVRLDAAEEARQALATFDGACQCVSVLPNAEARLAFLLMTIFDGNDPARAALEIVEPWIRWKERQASSKVDFSIMEDLEE